MSAVKSKANIDEMSNLANYQNKIKEKMKELDEQNKTVVTIPQYSHHFKSLLAKLPRDYYRYNKEHYMSVFEHLVKKYDVHPYIYNELEMNEDGYYPGQRHIFPHSGGCAQCSHNPVYINPHDPFRPNPPILNERSNKNHLRRWIEFTELNEREVLREEIQDEWNADQNRYLPVVMNQVVMSIQDARRLRYLMQDQRFSYDDFVGATPNYVNSDFTYDQPIVGKVESSFGQMLAKKKQAIKQKKQTEEDLKNEKELSEAQKELENKRKENQKIVDVMKEKLAQQELANKQLQSEIKFLKDQGTIRSKRNLNDESDKNFLSVNQQYNKKPVNRNFENQENQEYSEETKKLQRKLNQQPSIISGELSQFNIGEGEGDQQKSYYGFENNNRNKPEKSNKIQLKGEQFSNQLKEKQYEKMQRTQQQISRNSLSHIDGVRPDNQADYLGEKESMRNRPENRELQQKAGKDAFSMNRTQELKPGGGYQQYSQVQMSQSSFTHIPGGQKNFRPSSQIKLKSRAFLRNDEENLEPHNVSITEKDDQEIEHDAAILKSASRIDSREAKVQALNMRASQSKIPSMNFDQPSQHIIKSSQISVTQIVTGEYPKSMVNSSNRANINVLPADNDLNKLSLSNHHKTSINVPYDDEMDYDSIHENQIDRETFGSKPSPQSSNQQISKSRDNIIAQNLLTIDENEETPISSNFK